MFKFYCGYKLCAYLILSQMLATEQTQPKPSVPVMICQTSYPCDTKYQQVYFYFRFLFLWLVILELSIYFWL